MAKAPKKPKRAASLETWKKYDAKLAEYHKNKKAKEALIKKHSR